MGGCMRVCVSVCIHVYVCVFHASMHIIQADTERRSCLGNQSLKDNDTIFNLRFWKDSNKISKHTKKIFTKKDGAPFALVGNLSLSCDLMGMSSVMASGVHSTTSISSLSTRPSNT